MYNIAVLKSRKNLRKKKSWGKSFSLNHRVIKLTKLAKLNFQKSSITKKTFYHLYNYILLGSYL